MGQPFHFHFVETGFGKQLPCFLFSPYGAQSFAVQ